MPGPGLNLGLGLGAGGDDAAPSGQTLGALKLICKYHGWEERTPEGDYALKRFINRTLQLLAVLAPWPEYHKRDGEKAIVSGTDYYELSQSNIAHIGNVIRTTRMTPLDEIIGGIEEWLLKTKTVGSAGPPTQYALRKYVTDGDVKMEILLYPQPNASDTLYYTYRLMPVELVEDSDACDWPDYRLWLLEEALEKRIASARRDSLGVALESPEFMAQVQRALIHSRPSSMPMRVMKLSSTRGKTLRETTIQVTS